jgi:hypothetical protein
VNPSENFIWEPYLHAIKIEFESFGLTCEPQDRSTVPGFIKKAFLKQDSFGQVLNLQFKRSKSDFQKILIKLEIDTHPPLGSNYCTHFLEYPYPFSIVCQDESSLFAGKCHALLCREYVKGRDWFDFLWYLQRKSTINFNFLKNALEQCGPYQGTSVPISTNWLTEQLELKIRSIDWKSALMDVEKFISINDNKVLSSWSEEMFLAMAGQLSYLDDPERNAALQNLIRK